MTKIAHDLETNGNTVFYLAEIGKEKKVLGLFAFSDQAKSSTKKAIEQLHQLNIKTVMVTGDNERPARKIAEELGIDEVFAEVLPADKSKVISDLKKSGHTVAMVGDGINDAPALAGADVGIAMGSGTDVAMQAASVTLMRSDPLLLADTIDISGRTYAKIKENLFWAFIYNIVGIPLAAFGFLSPVLAGAAMALSSVSVVSNSLLLRRWKPKIS